MLKRYVNLSFVYAIIAMVFGVLYREFTKFSGFGGKTNLSVMHTHYFLLGMMMFLIFALCEKAFSFSGSKRTGLVIVLYNVGLNITGLGFLVRGLNQVWGTQLTKGMDASISGIAGIGHILLGVSLAILLYKIKKHVE